MISEIITYLQGLDDYDGFKFAGGLSLDEEKIKKSLTTSTKMIVVNHNQNRVVNYMTDSDYQDLHNIEIILKSDGDILSLAETLKSNLQGYEFEWSGQTRRVYYEGGVCLEATLYDTREIKTYGLGWVVQ